MISRTLQEQNQRFETSQSLAALGITPPVGYTPLDPESLPDTQAARLRQVACRFPQRPAYVSEDEVLTYAELDRAANRVAWAIDRRLAGGGVPVGLCLDPVRASMVAGHVGAVYSGHPYVALDPGFPRDRLAYALRDSGAGLILTDNVAEPLARELAGAAGLPTLNLDRLGDNLPDEPFESNIGPDDPVYIVYTSGSTGQPKGVVWASRTRLVATWLLNRQFYMHASDRFSMLHSYGFNSSSAELWTALLEGASVYPFDFRHRGIEGLADWLRRNEISIFHWIPSALRTLDAELAPGIEFPSVRVLFLMSEPVTEREVAIHRMRFRRESALVNRYGTTETGIACQLVVGPATEIHGTRVPSGYAVPGKKLLILNPGGEHAAPGEEGEIVIRSEFLSQGYWQRPELNRERFREIAGSRERVYFTGDRGKLQPDGCLEHLGRLDSQVKIRGHRVEIEEIEAALRRLPEVREAVVAVQETGADLDDTQRLVAYVVPRDGLSPTVTRLRAALAGEIVEGLVPDRFVVLSELPRTPTGKLDYRNLPDPGHARPLLDEPFAPPETPLEARLAEIWSEVLGIRPVGRHDRFADLGGSSLRMAQVVARVGREWGYSLTPADFYLEPTVRGLAGVVLTGLAAASGGAGLAELLAEIEALDALETGP